MKHRYDAVIIGGGFKGMMTAYGLRRQGKDVCLIEKGKQLGGFMSPMHWSGTDVDKGPQYLDGISEAHKPILDDIMSDVEPLTSLDYSYGSFWNDTYTEGFALPDYRSLPSRDVAAILYESLHHDHSAEAECIADLYSEDDSETYRHINNWCHKFLRQDATALSPLNRHIVTFFGRKLLLDNALSLDLKQHPLLDDTLAANKKGIAHGTYNLYPLGKNLGYFRQAFDDKLRQMQVTAVTETDVKSVRTDDGSLLIETSAGTVHADDIYCTATLEVSEHLLLGSDNMSAYIAPVAQIFYLLEVRTTMQLPFYVMNYSDSSVSRITHFTAYGNRNKDDHAILCIEVPTEIDSDIWNDPDRHYTNVLDEIAAMGIDTEAITEHQAFKVPGTYRVTLKGYESALAGFTTAVADRYGERAHIPTPHLLTRASIMNDLTAMGILK